jgi:hypothetical protein
MPVMPGVRFLVSEYGTGPVHGGRIDSLGIDENGAPVVVEYKRGRDLGGVLYIRKFVCAGRAVLREAAKLVAAGQRSAGYEPGELDVVEVRPGLRSGFQLGLRVPRGRQGCHWPVKHCGA